jgi:SAM-dependent methyltransferase
MVFAYLKHGGKFAYGLDVHDFSVESSRKIARILSMDKRCRFDVGDIEDLPFDDRSIDIFTSLETLEHVNRQKKALWEIARVTKGYIVIATPNRFYPKDTHNTGMVFGNYFPKSVRRAYVRLKGKEDDLHTMTRVMSPLSIERGLKGFRVISQIETFDSLEDWDGSRPYYMPYGMGKNRYRPRISRRRYRMVSRIHSLIGNNIRYILPNYCAILKRR